MTIVRDYLRATIQQIYKPTKPETSAEERHGRFDRCNPVSRPAHPRSGRATIRAKKILINTGAGPRIPHIQGLADVPYSTYLQIFDNDRLPQHFLVIGGGPIGCELAQAYRRLGSRVTVIAERFLPREEPEVSELLNRIFAEEGIERLNGRAEFVEVKAMLSLCIPSLEKRRVTFCLSPLGERRSFVGLVSKQRTCALRRMASK